MEFTKQQRNKLYIAALELIKSERCEYICEALNEAIISEYTTNFSFNEIPNLFPEFKEFKPIWQKFTDGGGWWDDGSEIRISVLESCISQTI